MPAVAEQVLTVPDLPAFADPPLTLRDAIKRSLVTGAKGERLNLQQLRRWATGGARIVAGEPLYQFPSIKGSRERVTCEVWCQAWNRWVSRLRSAAARRQVETWERCKRAVG